MAETYIAASRSDGLLVHIAVNIEPTAINIERILTQYEVSWAPLVVTNWRVLSKDEHEMFNLDREYRNALVDNAGRVEYNMPRARTIHLTKLRLERDAALDEKDKEYMRAVQQNDAQAARRIETEAQALRDMPTRVQPLLDAAATVEELKAIR